MGQRLGVLGLRVAQEDAEPVPVLRAGLVAHSFSFGEQLLLAAEHKLQSVFLDRLENVIKKKRSWWGPDSIADEQLLLAGRNHNHHPRAIWDNLM